MIFFFRRLVALILLIISLCTLNSCRSDTSDSQQGAQASHSQKAHHPSDSTPNSPYRGKHHHNKHHRPSQGIATDQTQSDQRSQLSQKGAIPQKVYDVLDYVRENKQPMDGYVGGRRFGNFENRLPKNDATGRAIQYQEWDINPKVQGMNRGTERLITGSDKRAYFTNDHYNSFTEIK